MKNRGGFTIIETLITLSISSALFVIIMVAFSGRQGRVEFAQGMRDIESYILDKANDVRNGYYPQSGLDCSFNGLALSFSAGTNKQGTNSPCVFLGKVMLVNSKITSYSVAGLRTATSMSDSKLMIIGDDSPDALVAGTQTQEDYTLPAGIQLIKQDSNTQSVLLGMFFNLGGGGANTTGTTSVTPYQLKPTTSNFVDIKASVKGAFTVPANLATEISDKLVLCFKSGTNSQTGIITLKKTVDGITADTLIDQDLSGVSCAVGVSV